MSKQKKNAAQIDRDIEIRGAKMFGKHVTEEKRKLLLGLTMLTCAAPMVAGLRLWNVIPEIYETGLVGANGEDDSLPRWAVAVAIPALMCLLNFLCHNQLRMSQKQMVLPKAYFRLVGRWGFPIISVLFAGGLIREAAGLQALALTYLTPCVMGLGLMILGAHMYDCKEDSMLALNFSFLKSNPILRKETHRFAGYVWLLAGLGVIVMAMLTDLIGMAACAVALLALTAPWFYGRSKAANTL